MTTGFIPIIPTYVSQEGEQNADIVAIEASDTIQNAMLLHSTYYGASGLITAKPVSVAADRYKIQLPYDGGVVVGDQRLYWTNQPIIDLSSAASWDTQAVVDYTVAANRAGVNQYLYACQPVSGSTPDFVLSANSTIPDGYDEDSSRKISSWHGLCLDVGTIAGHTLTGYVAGDILIASVCDMAKLRPVSSCEGMVYLGNGWWADIYPKSGTGANTASVFGATISDSQTWLDVVDDLAAVGKVLPTDSLFQIMAALSNEGTNIYGGADPDKTGLMAPQVFTGSGLNDITINRSGFNHASGAQEYEIEIETTGATDTIKWRKRSFAGGTGSWSGYTTGVALTGAAQALADGITIAAAAITGHTMGNKTNFCVMNAGFNTAGRRMISKFGLEMCCGAIWQWLDTQSFRVDAIQSHTHTVTVSGDPETPTTSGPTPADISPTWSYYALPGGKGQLYKQGPYGDVRLLAGGSWNNGSYCGSRSRYASNSRWNASSNLGARGCARSRTY